MTAGRVHSLPQACTSAASYVREARRLRARHARQPAKLAAELRKLAIAAPASPTTAPAPLSPAPVLRIPPATANAFATDVESALRHGNGVLRYSARQQLLTLARGYRIPPFEANLLIASVLHHHRTAGPAGLVKPPKAAVRLIGVALTLTALLAAMLLA